MRVNIKPLTVNRAWKGRRFKTDEYKRYEKELMSMLPEFVVPETDLSIRIEFGFSSKLADFDNPVKPFIDCLQKKYGFNDRQIKKALIMVRHVEKGAEYIDFELFRFVSATAP